MKYFLDPFLMNMYISGIIRGNDEMGKLKTINNDYTIIINRQDIKLWYTDTNFKYICKFSFINNLNIEVFSFQVPENDIYIMIDNIYQFLEYKMKNIIFNISNYNIEFIRNENIFMKIYEYSNIVNNIIPRITIEFDEDNLLEFVNLIYFCFLIDIDSCNMNNNSKNY